MAAADQSRTPDDCLWLVAGTGSSGPEHPRHFEYCLSFLILVIWEMLFLPGAAWGVSFFPKPQLGLQALILLGAGSPKKGTQGLFVGTMLEPCWNHVGTRRPGGKKARPRGKKASPGRKKAQFFVGTTIFGPGTGEKSKARREKSPGTSKFSQGHVGTMLEPCWNHGSLVGCFFLNFVVFFVSGPCFFPVYPSGPLSIRDLPYLGPNPGRFGVVHQRAIHIKGETRTVPGSKSPRHRPAFSFLFNLCQGQTS